jgi:hypothetical protein
MNWLGLSAINPMLLWGALAVAAPILIHLLSKRKFRIVNWAAMDFLLEADRRNRRRVQLEHLILLLLRCLAILLIAALVARPFFTPQQGLGRIASNSVVFERIFLLDDSPSTAARGAQLKPVFDDAKAGLAEFIEELAASRPGDRITLLLTSSVDTPIFNGKILGGPAGQSGGTSDEVNEMLGVIRNLEPSDRTADLAAGLAAIERLIERDTSQLNRAVYVISDLRQRDWGPSPGGSPDRSAARLAGQLAAKVQSFTLVDVATEPGANLTIADIRLQDEFGRVVQLVPGMAARFAVTVRNPTGDEARDVDVELSIGEAGTQRKTLTGPIAPGAEAAVTFDFRLPRSAFEMLNGSAAFIPVRASIEGADELAQDNQRLLAARVTQGIRILVVDGDAGLDDRQSERRYLIDALTLQGRMPTNFQVDWLADTQFDETTELAKYQLVYLLNVYRLPEDILAPLDKWVQDGGGLVVALGDKVDHDDYNDKLHKGGAGLLPVALVERQGDESRETWVDLTVEHVDHPALAQLVRADSARRAIERFNVFQWWHTKTPDDSQPDGQIRVPIRFTDPDNSPAMVDRAWGSGRVIVFTLPLNLAWSDWPGHPGYIPVMHEVAQYAARTDPPGNSLLVGEPIRRQLDPSDYHHDVQVSYRGQEQGAEPETTSLVAVLDEQTNRLRFEFAKTDRTGLYDVVLSRFDSGKENGLVAVNLDPDEGDLKRIAPEELNRLAGVDLPIVKRRATLAVTAEGAKNEFWFSVLVALVGVLALEQTLAWLFGRRR